VVRRLYIQGRRLLLVDEQDGSWVFCGQLQAFLSRSAVELLEHMAAGDLSPEAAGGDGAAALVRLLQALPGMPEERPVPAEVDVAVIGAGPAGLMAGATAASHLGVKGAGVAVLDPGPGGALTLVDSITVGFTPGMAFRTAPLVSRLVHGLQATGAHLVHQRVRTVSGRAGDFSLELGDGRIMGARVIVLAVGMTGPLYRACFTYQNARDNMRSPDAFVRTAPGHRVVLIGDHRIHEQAADLHGATGADIHPLDVVSTGEETWAPVPVQRRLTALLGPGLKRVEGDLFLFDRSYFGPRLPAGLVTETATQGAVSGVFPCGDCTADLLGFCQALATGQWAGFASAAFCNPAAQGLKWARLPLAVLQSGGDSRG